MHTLALFRTDFECTPKANTQTNSNVDWRPVDCIGPKIVAKCRLIFFSRALCCCCCAYSYCFMMYFHQSILRLHGFTRQPKGRKCMHVLTQRKNTLNNSNADEDNNNYGAKHDEYKSKSNMHLKYLRKKVKILKQTDYAEFHKNGYYRESFKMLGYSLLSISTSLRK